MSMSSDCTALAPGLWRIALPFPSPLRFSFSYLVEGSNGFVAIDSGWDLDETWSAFLSGLARAGGTLDRLRGVVVTHAHPDHHGLAGRILQNSDAWIGLHPADQGLLAPEESDRRARISELEEWLFWCGVPAGERESVLGDHASLMLDVPATRPTLDIFGDQVIPETDGALTSIHTPGHTLGHLAFHDSERQVIFTGDHLLPRISANISYRPGLGGDPLGDYSESLGKLEPYVSSLVAPGHEWTFDNMSKRLDEVRKHHTLRLDEVFAAVCVGATTVWEVARAVTWSRRFEDLNPRGRRAALGEAASHLVHLEREKKLVRADATVGRWSAT